MPRSTATVSLQAIALKGSLLPGALQRQQNGSMVLTSAPAIEERLAGMAAAIRQLIPAAEVRLYSCGEASGYLCHESNVHYEH